MTMFVLVPYHCSFFDFISSLEISVAEPRTSGGQLNISEEEKSTVLRQLLEGDQVFEFLIQNSSIPFCQQQKEPKVTLPWVPKDTSHQAEKHETASQPKHLTSRGRNTKRDITQYKGEIIYNIIIK